MTNDQIRTDLLARLRGVERIMRADLLAKYRADPALLARAFARLEEEESALAGRESWLETFAGRGAVLYILKSLYVRVLEDQGLLTPERIRGGGTYEFFRRLFPQLGYAAYLRTVFTDAERAFPELFALTPVEIAQPSEASARALWEVWQEAAAGGGPFFDFRGDLDTRFIGDLYQDLDPEVKARYALLQTPQFIEEFILDRTLEPALGDFGLDEFRIIDPTCGSGHFLLGAFERLFAAWCERLGSGADERWEAAERALAAVYGADLNEYACALSRIRLLLAVVRLTGVKDGTRLRALHYNVITCDSLIPWERLSGEMLPGTSSALAWLVGYGSAAERERNETFFAPGFHAVVGNPPYIAVQDKKKRADYRRAWPRSATGKYSLSAPMTERFLLLPVTNGHTGMIVGSNFCKAEFGKGVIERVLPDVTLTLIVDTSGASLPGHATPTIIMISRRQRPNPRASTVKLVASLHGGPAYLAKPEEGFVWQSIVSHWRSTSFEDESIAVRELLQESLVKHPWALNSASASEVLTKLKAFRHVEALGADAGPAVIIIEDEAFIRRYAHALPLRRMVSGKDVRDWCIRDSSLQVVAPLRGLRSDFEIAADAAIDLWHLRSTLFGRPTFGGQTYRECPKEKTWWQFHQVVADRVREGTSRIVVGEITSNSQFVYDASDAVFTQDAPVLTVPEADREQYLDIAAVLNSSSLEFWFKSRCRIKNGWGENWEWQYARNGTNVLQAPLPGPDTFSSLRN